MARLNVYVPDELAEQAKSADLNVSALTQAAIAAELARRTTDAWLDTVPTQRPRTSHEAAMAALDDARAEFGSERD